MRQYSITMLVRGVEVPLELSGEALLGLLDGFKGKSELVLHVKAGKERSDFVPESIPMKPKGSKRGAAEVLGKVRRLRPGPLRETCEAFGADDSFTLEDCIGLLGHPRPQIRTTMTRGVSAGYLRRFREGVYAVTEKGREAVKPKKD